MTETNKPRGTQDEQYARREVGLRMLSSGEYKHAEIAKLLGVAHGTVRGWSSKLGAKKAAVKKSVKTKGVRGRREGVGRALKKAQQSKIIAIIRDNNPRQLKMEFYLWSVGAVMTLIENTFGVKLSESGTRKYLNEWGFTVQRPATRYTSRDDVLVQKWLETDYPKIAARAREENAEIHWLDETGVNNQAIYQRSYSPRGKTPVTGKPARREKISMISTVTNRGTMRFSLYEGGLKTPIFIRFLENLLKGTSHKIFVIMDNLRVHKSKEFQAWLADNADRIEVFYLPPYAPDLNPDEYLNNDLKQNVHRRSGLPLSKEKLKANVRAYLRHIQKSPAKVRSYFNAPEIKYAA
ncbi:MAG: IS630 family transposase [Actinobacteria bacterium]|nr:IS630 family transposase [Actinomycetota bacterium]